MARIVSIDGQPEQTLTQGWRMALSPPGACVRPADARRLTDWIPAEVPGTAAGALRRAGRANGIGALHEQDVWWRLSLDASGPRLLRLDGVATVSEIWLGERLISTSRSMFAGSTVEVELTGGETLWICCRSLDEALARKLPRARWRTQMIPRQGLRGVRTTLLGQMPGWTPDVDAVGPWRPVILAPSGPLQVTDADVQARFDGRTGRLTASMRITGAQGPVALHCGGRSAPLAGAADGAFTGALELPGIAPWWPHTHGEPVLHPVSVTVGDTVIDLGRTGFRDIAPERGPEGKSFGIVVNGQRVFCRGANWTSADVVDLPCSRERYRPWLELARDAGMNMLRMSGTGAYEGAAFFELCDELGILVWQDFMFANFDYPIADPDFEAQVREESDGFLNGIQLSPSLAVVCGGSEVLQQATMMGLEPAAIRSRLYDDILPAAVGRRRPDAVYVDNSPTGGPLPFVPNEGVAHYFGVGAYLRPMEDARRAEVTFASECLAFANLPRPGVMSDKELLTGAGVPRDLGANWDFADVRDHYLGRLHGVDPASLRRDDPDLYLTLSRQVSGEVMEATFAEWRRARSSCRGALVWTFQDLEPGAGWGVIDSEGRPKPAWYALKRAFSPLHLALTDEGNAGLAVHIANERPQAMSFELELTCLRDGAVATRSARTPVDIGARDSVELSAFAILGAFYDLNRAFRFGPPGHDAVLARLRRAGDEAVLTEAFHFPGPASPLPARLEANVARLGDGWTLDLSTDRLVRSVGVEAPGFTPSDDGFHLAPGAVKRVMLRSDTGREGPPEGIVRTRTSAVRFG